jgi:hypothetical protein
MRFAIFGEHSDGWRMARALRDSGRHQIVAYAGDERPEGDWPNLRITKDFEELLADPQIEAVIVASDLAKRLDHLRRVLQSERSALCVHPCDARPDGGYEIHMLQGDVHQIVLPILPEAMLPELDELRKTLDLNAVIALDISSRLMAVNELGPEQARPAFPGWTLLRRAGGEISEISTFAAQEEVRIADTVLGCGKFLSGQLLRASWLSAQPENRVRLSFAGVNREPIDISLNDPALWQRIIERFEFAVERLKTAPRVPPGSGPALDLRDGLGWNDEIRALELNDLARRSIERRRAYSLDFQEATEEVGFKGTMTLVGCALLWLIPLVLLLSAWIPWLFWLVVPVLLVFLALQFLKGKGAEGKDGNKP